MRGTVSAFNHTTEAANHERESTHPATVEDTDAQVTVRSDPRTEDADGSITEIAETDLVSRFIALLSLKILICHCMTVKQLILVNSPAKLCRYSARP